MYDQELVLEDLRHIDWSLKQIATRFASVSSCEDFMKDDAGLEKLDSICMQLITIGETLKHLDKLTDAKLLAAYQDLDWKKAMGMRDIITHHYFDIDSETIFAVCTLHLPLMGNVIGRIIDDVEHGISAVNGGPR
jgi:uncharacterized protein with HEPN domain